MYYYSNNFTTNLASTFLSFDTCRIFFDVFISLLTHPHALCTSWCWCWESQMTCWPLRAWKHTGWKSRGVWDVFFPQKKLSMLQKINFLCFIAFCNKFLKIFLRVPFFLTLPPPPAPCVHLGLKVNAECERGRRREMKGSFLYRS